MSRQFWIGLIFCAFMLFLLWGPLSKLLFGGTLGSGVPGDWVGTMTITQGYPRPDQGVAVQTILTPPVKAAVFLNLSLSDSFMHEYSGPGEINIQGRSPSLPLQLRAFRIHTPDPRAHGAFICKGLLEDGVEGSFTRDHIHLEHQFFPMTIDGSLVFTMDLHHGSRAEYQQLLLP